MALMRRSWSEMISGLADEGQVTFRCSWILRRAHRLTSRAVVLRSTGKRVSSSARESLSSGDLETAERFFGTQIFHPGACRLRSAGRTIGFPDSKRPSQSRESADLRGLRGQGVSVTDMTTHCSAWRMWERRPTVNGEGVQLEVNLFDFDQAIYGERIDVEMVARIRPEQKFESLDALKAQIARDADTARDILGVDSLSPWLGLAAIVLIVDQMSKYAAEAYLSLHVPVAILPGLNFTLTYNPGAAFSFERRWRMATVVFQYRLRRKPRHCCLAAQVAQKRTDSRRAHWHWCLAVLSVISTWDRLAPSRGMVVDFIDVYAGKWHWPV